MSRFGPFQMGSGARVLYRQMDEGELTERGERLALVRRQQGKSDAMQWARLQFTQRHHRNPISDDETAHRQIIVFIYAYDSYSVQFFAS